MSVYKRRGRWHFSKTINGARYRGALKTARTKVQAEEAERAILFKVHQGTYAFCQDRQTLAEFVDETYLPWAKANKRSWRIDISRLKPIREFFGKKKMGDISPFLIESFKIKRMKAEIVYRKSSKLRTPASVNRELCLLSKIFALAVRDRKLAENPCRHINLLSGEKSRTRYLSPDEERRLLVQLTGVRAHLLPMVILDINTGLREMELLTLKPEHIDFHRVVIYVKGTKSDEDRDVPINGTARKLLTELIAVAEQNGHEYLFTNPKTKRHHVCVKNAWNTACRRAGIANLRFHDLRHTFGTRAVDNGASIAAVQKVMGHKSIETTMQYVHATDEGKRRVVEAVERTQKSVSSSFPVTIRTQNENRRLA